MKRLSDVKRIGYGAMRLSRSGHHGPAGGPRRGPPRCCSGPIELGVDHIDTSDYYGPYVVNDLIREALPPTRPSWCWSPRSGPVAPTTARGCRRSSPTDIKEAVHDNLGRLGVERLGGVNLRSSMDGFEGSIDGAVDGAGRPAAAGPGRATSG